MTESESHDLILSGRIDPERISAFAQLVPTCRVLREDNRIRFCGLDRQELSPAFTAALSTLKNIDASFVPSDLSLKRFACAFFDMDSTLIVNECIDELAALYGVKAQISQITERSMRGELDFEHSLRERVALLAGAPCSIIEEAAARIRPTPGARESLAFLHRHGIKTYILSGGFTQFAQRTAAEFGMTNFVCNSLVIRNGVLTGEVTGPAGGHILDRSGKRRALEVIAQLNGVSTNNCIAGGDGANDLEMIAAAGLGFAYHAKPIVAQSAPQRIDYGSFAVLTDWFIESWS